MTRQRLRILISNDIFFFGKLLLTNLAGGSHLPVQQVKPQHLLHIVFFSLPSLLFCLRLIQSNISPNSPAGVKDGSPAGVHILEGEDGGRCTSPLTHSHGDQHSRSPDSQVSFLVPEEGIARIPNFLTKLGGRGPFKMFGHFQD